MITSGNRLHGIDALRAFAMLSGVLLHSVLAYRVSVLPMLPHDPQFNCWLFDFIFFFIHSFRMPLFFLIAGFFCRMMYFRSGEKKFLQQRFRRIVIPFIAGIFIIAPLTLLPKYLYWYTINDELTLQQAFSKAFKKIVAFNEIEHIWFLRNLIIYYLIVILMQKLKNITFINSITARGFKLWQHTKLSILWLIILTIPVWVFLIPMRGWYVTTDTYTIPKSIIILLFYGYFFMLGWLLHIRQDIFSLFSKKYFILLISAIATTLFVWYIKQNYDFAKTSFIVIAVTKLVTALQMILLVCGISGLFLRFLDTENNLWRYLSDASYWVYLVHLAVIFFLQWQLIDSPIPGILRFPLVFLSTAIFAFFTYHYFVRYTIIGDILHGPRKK